MDRRSFLSISFSLFTGSILDFSGLSRLFKSQKVSDNSYRPRYGIDHKPRVAIIIDDIGYSFSMARKFLSLDLPITYSILPRLKKGPALANEIHSYGKEIMVHQPMEPLSRTINPGPGALYVKDSPQRITSIMKENISIIPYAVGVNNHMGSRFTADREGIDHALRVVKENGLFFIDSLTSYGSVAYNIAKEKQIASGYRNVFLDNHANLPYILSQLDLLFSYARKYGYAIGIGHPFPETARAIALFTSTENNFKDMLVNASEVIG